MPFQIASGNNTANIANVDSNSNLFVNLPTVATQAGYVKANHEVDSGAVTGISLVRSPKVTVGRNMQVVSESPILYEFFNYTAGQNTADFKYLTTTLTVAFTVTGAQFNSGAVTSAGEALLQSYRSIPMYSDGGITATFNASLSIAPVANFQAEFGFFSQSGSAPYTPNDGAYFRYTPAGLIGVANFNGTESTTGTLIPASSSTLTQATTYQIIVFPTKVEFWQIGTSGSIAAVLLGSLFNATSMPFTSGALPVSIRQLNTATTSSAIQLKVAWLEASFNDFEANKPWAHALAGDGAMIYQGQNGGSMGTTALFANSSNPTAAVPSNTTAALGSGLGGNFWSTATIAVNTDGIISSYQNPLGSTTQQPRGMYITAIRIDSAIQTTLTGGPFILQWSLAFGHTSVSLATAEGAASKAPRRIALGIQTFSTSPGLTAGNIAAPLSSTFTTPIYINPGEFIQTVYKNIGTVGTAGTIAHSITFDGYWE
jgi:hypothetical protein